MLRFSKISSPAWECNDGRVESKNVSNLPSVREVDSISASTSAATLSEGDYSIPIAARHKLALGLAANLVQL